MTTTVPILMYHEISARLDPRYRKYTLTPQELERQLDWLGAHAYRTVTMDDVQGVDYVRRLDPGRVIPVHYDDYRVFRSPLGDFVDRAERDGLLMRVQIANCAIHDLRWQRTRSR